MKTINKISSVDALKSNVLHIKGIVREAIIFLRHLSTLTDLENMDYRINVREKRLLTDAINSLMIQLKIVNNSLPEIVKRISFFKEMPSGEPERKEMKRGKEQLISVSYKHPAIKEREAVITIRKEDRIRFLRELSLTDNSVRRLKKEYKIEKVTLEEFKKPRGYAKISNKLFSNLSTNLLERGYFTKLNSELRKSNIPFLTHTYISMAFFSSLLSIGAAILFVILLLFFKLSIDFPFLIPLEESLGLRFIKIFWLIFATPVLTFLAFYFYPTTEKKSIASKINQELPFVVIHMSAVAGSGVEPTKIFRIIITGSEYPHIKKELKKLINQINVYGYDLVSALRDSARHSPSNKVKDLFNGLSTTITSGGSLTDFLNKRAETLVFDYKIEREKYTKMAETFMDIYISVVIAAPMIMTLLLIMMSLTGLSFGLSLGTLSLLMIFAIALINILFLVFLHLKQPEF